MGDYYVWVHAGLMGAAWLGLAPLSVFIARYLKAKLGVWWFRLHVLIGIMILCVTTAGFIIILVKFDEPIPYSDPHVALGMIVFIGMYLQSILGFVMDRLFKPDRKSVPWWDQIHWWWGRLLLIISWVALPLGFRLYGDSIHAEQNDFIAYGVAVFVILLIFAVAEWFLKPVLHVDGKIGDQPDGLDKCEKLPA